MTQLVMDFANVFQLVDTSTVIGYLHKQDAKLKPIQGIQVSEIQTAGSSRMAACTIELGWTERTIVQIWQLS